MTGTTRRKFLGVVGLGTLLATSSGTAVAQQTIKNEPFNGIAVVVGSQGDIPTVGGGFFDNKPVFHYLHLDRDTGVMHSIEDGDDSWTVVPGSRGRLVDALLEDQPVTNTMTETTVFSPSLPADRIFQGDVYELTATGAYTTTNGSEQFTLRFHLGGTEVAAVTSVAAQVTDAPWYAILQFSVRSVGEAGTVKPHVVAAFDNVHDDQHSGTVTLDTTVDETFDLTVQWDEQNTGNEVLVGQAYLERLGMVPV